MMPTGPRRYLYSGLLIWAVILLLGLAYFKFIRDQDQVSNAIPGVAGNNYSAKPNPNPETNGSTNNGSATKANVGAETQAIKLVNHKAPPFTLPRAGGGKLSLASLRGHPVLVEFIASWCPHCRAMAPVFARAVRQSQKSQKSVKYVMISAAREPHARVVKWTKTFLSRPMPGQLVFDDSLSVARSYAVVGYPTTAFIDARGKLHFLLTGEIKPQTLKNNLRAIGG